MDDIRESLSKMKKGIKHRLTVKKRKEAGGHGVGVDSSGPPPDEPDAHRESDRVGASATEWESDWATTASAKLLLRGVSSSSDAFGPLESVASGLCFILENCEVRLRLRMLSETLIGLAAYGGEQASNRIVSTQGQDTQ